jgi:putative spermidine/putrescine transport system ATP-binding protein
VAKSFSGRRVLEPLTLAVAEGGKTVLLGPSGCGKTTALRLIAGLETADPGGRIVLGGRDVTFVPPEKREISMMFQNYALFPNMTVFENIAYGLRIRKIPRRERTERVGALLEMTRLAGFASRSVGSLSGGQKQRVALARSLATRPRVLLLDEPLGALDAALRASVREEMDELLTALGVTAVIVTHDQDEAMSLGDQIAVMREGRLEQAGSPAEIYHRPATEFVASFVGGSNRLDGRVRDGVLILEGGAGVPLPPDTIRTLRDDGRGGVGEYPVVVYFRPDAAKICDPSPGLVRGRVASSRFAGGVTRVALALESGARLRLELPGGRQVSPGSLAGVSLPAEDLIVFRRKLPS